MSSNNKEKKKEKTPEIDITWFLLNCIMHSEAGRLSKIDFDVVAEKLNLKTKIAATMRYQRLLKSYGLTSAYTPRDAGAADHAPYGDSAASEPPTPLKSTPVKNTPAKTTPAKKRKPNKRKRQDPEPTPEPESEPEPEDVKHADDEAEDTKNVHDVEDEA